MGFDEGRIILDSDVGTYFAGQTVFGRVVFDQETVITIHGIYADMNGLCKVHWTKQKLRTVNNRTQFHTVSYDAHEEYFHSKSFIFGDENGEHHLQPGHHELRFECHIPANCPSSFEGTHGHIRYRIKVVMVTSGVFSLNKENIVAVKVKAPLDLNQNPYCKEPIEYELLSTYCCLCFNAGHSEVLVRLPVGGYCPGQVIPIEVKCKNPSSVDIEELKFAIKKDVTFTATSQAGTRYEHDTVAEISKGPIPAGTTRNWTVEMEVPSMDIYNVDACRFIDITYTFKVSTKTDDFHEGSDDVRPIIFGTIPLVGYQDKVQNPLHDQLFKPIGVQNVLAVNCYPPPPIINQPLTNPPYPIPPSADQLYFSGNQMPNVSPYPPNPPYPVTPSLDSKPPYPVTTSTYPGANPPYPGATSPYLTATSPYPGAITPYPVTPNRGTNPPVVNSISPGANPPYPVTSPKAGENYPKLSDMSSPGLVSFKTGTLGFTVGPLQKSNEHASLLLLPTGANTPYPTTPAINPYTSASAPEPSTHTTPGSDQKTLDDLPQVNVDSNNPEHNPDFTSDKNEKHN